MGLFDGIIKYIREPDEKKVRDAAGAINDAAEDKLTSAKNAANDAASLAESSGISKTSKE